MKQKMTPRARGRLARGTSFPALVIALAIAAAGCSDSEAESVLVGPDEEASVSDIPAFTLADLPPALDLTPEQAAAMEGAIDELNRSRSSRRERWARALSDEGRWRDRLARLDPEREPPLVAFLETSSRTLDTDQFTILCAHLIAERGEQRASRVGGDGNAPGRRERTEARRAERDRQGGRSGHARMAEALGISGEQADRLRELRRSTGDEMRAVIASVRSGEMTVEAGIAGATRIAEAARAEAATILSPEQMAELEELKQERISRGIDRRLENLDDRLTRRGGFLSRVLALSPEQASRVEQLLLASIPERESLLRATRDGGSEPEMALLRGIQLERGLLEQIRGVLTEEQRARLDALADLLPLGSPGHRGDRPRFGGRRR
jgi:Spy/CpxP family protein refolding chaperone